jgi:hypothetical protein
MRLESIKHGSSGEAVRAWQYFLLGHGLYKGVVDGDFGDATEKGTRRYQALSGLRGDGWVGKDTYAAAIVDGFDPVDYGIPEFGETQNPNWPENPGVSPLSVPDKHRLFGRIQYRLANNPRDPEAIVITNGWEKNIVMVELPQLVGVKGAGRAKKFPFHKKVAPQVAALFEAWAEHNYTQLIFSYAGSWVPRFVRGSRTTLSSHAWGTAFDINAAWNGYGRRPAMVGEEGCVRELVELAVEHGFFWGGWFPNRVDGMHFECYDVL